MARSINVITEDRASGGQVIDGSLKFDSSKSQYLTKTFGSAGNRKTNTASVWIKGVVLVMRIKEYLIAIQQEMHFTRLR